MAKRKLQSKARARPSKVVKGGSTCGSCGWFGWVVLLVGVLMLGQNLGWWAFWTVGGWSAAFTLLGLLGVLKK